MPTLDILLAIGSLKRFSIKKTTQRKDTGIRILAIKAYTPPFSPIDMENRGVKTPKKHNGKRKNVHIIFAKTYTFSLIL